MPDTVVAPGTAETSPAPVTVVETAPAGPVQGNPSNEAARAALYEKHYGSPEPVGDGTADTATPDPTQVSVAQTDPPVTAPVAAIPPEMIQVLQAMQAELVELRTKVTPVAPTVNTEHAPAPDWIALLREGRVDEAKRALVADVAKELQGPTKEQVETAVTQRVAAERERSQAEATVSAFVTEVRSANADIIELEPYITAVAQTRLTQLQAEGKMKTTEEIIANYKKVVLDSTAEARKLAQKFRGSGKEQASIRNREVISATPIPPQQVDAARAQQTTNSEPEPQSLESYFEKRKAAETQRRGMAV